MASFRAKLVTAALLVFVVLFVFAAPANGRYNKDDVLGDVALAETESSGSASGKGGVSTKLGSKVKTKVEKSADGRKSKASSKAEGGIEFKSKKEEKDKKKDKDFKSESKSASNAESKVSRPSETKARSEARSEGERAAGTNAQAAVESTVVFESTVGFEEEEESEGVVSFGSSLAQGVADAVAEGMSVSATKVMTTGETSSTDDTSSTDISAAQGDAVTEGLAAGTEGTVSASGASLALNTGADSEDFGALAGASVGGVSGTRGNVFGRSETTLRGVVQTSSSDGAFGRYGTSNVQGDAVTGGVATGFSKTFGVDTLGVGSSSGGDVKVEAGSTSLSGAGISPSRFVGGSGSSAQSFGRGSVGGGASGNAISAGFATLDSSTDADTDAYAVGSGMSTSNGYSGNSVRGEAAVGTVGSLVFPTSGVSSLRVDGGAQSKSNRFAEFGPGIQGTGSENTGGGGITAQAVGGIGSTRTSVNSEATEISASITASPGSAADAQVESDASVMSDTFAAAFDFAQSSSQGQTASTTSTLSSNGNEASTRTDAEAKTGSEALGDILTLTSGETSTMSATGAATAGFGAVDMAGSLSGTKTGADITSGSDVSAKTTSGSEEGISGIMAESLSGASSGASNSNVDVRVGDNYVGAGGSQSGSSAGGLTKSKAYGDETSASSGQKSDVFSQSLAGAGGILKEELSELTGIAAGLSMADGVAGVDISAGATNDKPESTSEAITSSELSAGSVAASEVIGERSGSIGSGSLSQGGGSGKVFSAARGEDTETSFSGDSRGDSQVSSGSAIRERVSSIPVPIIGLSFGAAEANGESEIDVSGSAEGKDTAAIEGSFTSNGQAKTTSPSNNEFASQSTGVANSQTRGQIQTVGDDTEASISTTRASADTLGGVGAEVFDEGIASVFDAMAETNTDVTAKGKNAGAGSIASAEAAGINPFANTGTSAGSGADSQSASQGDFVKGGTSTTSSSEANILKQGDAGNKFASIDSDGLVEGGYSDARGLERLAGVDLFNNEGSNALFKTSTSEAITVGSGLGAGAAAAIRIEDEELSGGFGSAFGYGAGIGSAKTSLNPVGGMVATNTGVINRGGSNGFTIGDSEVRTLGVGNGEADASGFGTSTPAKLRTQSSANSFGKGTGIVFVQADPQGEYFSYVDYGSKVGAEAMGVTEVTDEEVFDDQGFAFFPIDETNSVRTVYPYGSYIP